MCFYFGPDPTHQSLGFQTVTGRKNNFLGRGQGQGQGRGRALGWRQARVGAGMGVEAGARGAFDLCVALELFIVNPIPLFTMVRLLIFRHKAD